MQQIKHFKMRIKTINLERCGSGLDERRFLLNLDGWKEYTMWRCTVKLMYATVIETLKKSSIHDDEVGFNLPGNYIGHILLPREELVSLYKKMKKFFGESKVENKERKKPGRKPKVKNDE